ncbi:von Willebrand factor A-like domain protein [Campylobacter phage F356]|uniref:von Willebrand factor A-like domain protein n=2 Tax=Fletchervirus CPX TaxID=1110702 RepID=A0A7T3KEC9_9CAUD|nr:von Willebrand factor A-like domain protein [Campylobacter phage F355]QPX63654.1 von Willebrand factor A-like domain protein [Campylobacter phage F356]
MKFVNSLSNLSYTENGALTLSSSLNIALDLFFIIGTTNENNIDNVFEKVKESFNIDKELTSRILLWTRDAREGAGRREIFKRFLDFIAENDKEIYKRIIRKVPELGRFDDLITDKQLDLVGNELIKILDFNNQLCAKWMPREKSSKSKLAKKLMKLLKLNAKDYRKLLSSNTCVVENKMCSKEWNLIEYEKIPSKAMAKYNDAFERNDKERFENYQESLIKGESKVNTSAIYPYEIIKLMFKNDILANEMWKNQKNWMEGSKKTLFPIIDVSGSMYTGVQGSITALNIAISLGMYLSERNGKGFKDYFITFSANPEMVKIEGNNLKEKYESIKKSNWGMNTNFAKTFDLILNRAKADNLSQEDLPDALVILSDMEFDEAQQGKTNFEYIRDSFKNSGYKMPELIFWNIYGRSGNIPVRKDENGTCLISGFSPSIVKGLLTNDLNPEKIMFETINKERYDF